MSDEHHTCHCSHVVVVVNDLKRMERLAWIVVVAVVGVLVHWVTGAMGSHVEPTAATGRPDERMGSDRVPRPEQIQGTE